MAAGDIVIRWVSESSAAIRDMKRVEGALGDTMSKTEKWRGRLDKAATIGTAAFAAMIPVAIKVTMAASDQEQAIGSLNAVFKQYSDEMREAAKQAYQIGLSTTQYSQMAAVLGAQLKNLGIDTKEASGTTQELINLGADLAAQFGGTTADAVQALGSLLRGERDPIEKYGISINEAAIKAKMAEGDMGKLEATLALLNEQAKKTGALGAAGREAETLASGLQQSKAAFENLNASLGTALGGTGKGGALGKLADALTAISTWVEENPAAFRKIANGIAAVTGALVALKAALAVAGPLKAFLAVISNPFTIAAGWVAFEKYIDRMSDQKGGVFRLLSWLKDISDFLSNPVGNSLEIAIGQIIKTVRGAIDLFTNFKDTLAGIRDTIGGLNPFGGALAPTVALNTGSSLIGRPAAAPGTQVNVFVDGQRQPARVAVEPAWAPHLTMGVV